MTTISRFAALTALIVVACGTDGRAPHPPPASAAPEPPVEIAEPSPETPEEPLAPAGPIEPAFACAADGDCLNSCNHGAVNRAWYAEQYPGGERCEDGCTSKGTEPAKCIDGLCVAFRLGRRSDECTRRQAEVIPGIGPAHACASDDDCMTSCTYGAVNHNWYSYSVERGSECKDGCASKGADARCEDGRCVAYLRGERSEGCTGRNIHRPGI